MEMIKRELAAGLTALLVCCYAAPVTAQSFASAATPVAAEHNSSSQAVPSIAVKTAATAPSVNASTNANPSTPAATEKTAATTIPLSTHPAASASAGASICATPTASAPAASWSLRPAALIAPGKHLEETAAGQKLYDQTSEDTRGNPMNWSLHVLKSRHRTEVYFKGRLLRVYHAVFGRSRWTGGKQWEGDTRTPEGSYLITEKRRSSRFDWFLKLSYPNGFDQERFEAMKASHEISAGAREGGQVGIHGTDSPGLNVRDVNWTLGCISVDNSDVEEMARLLPVGTLVVINP